MDYHDHEWGVPEKDSQKLFALLMLEAFQAGLSWITILKKREAFFQAFAGFAPEVVARWGEGEVESLLQNAGIIRHRGKIEAVIRGAKAYLSIEAREGFSPFIWSAVQGRPLQNRFQTLGMVPASTPASITLSKRLKAEGFGFCGPTTCYAFMQAAGLVNDHLTHCPRHAEVAQLR